MRQYIVQSKFTYITGSVVKPDRRHQEY